MEASLTGISVAILAGGVGTRLRSVVADRPMILAPVAGRPFVTYLLDQVRAAGVQEVALLVGYAAGQVREALGDCYCGMRLTYSTESQPLGTAGAVRLATPYLREPVVLLLNGDSYCDVDFTRLLVFHHRSKALATLALAEVSDTSRYGGVCTDPAGRVVGFQEKGGGQAAGWINAGVYLMQRNALDQIPPGQPVSLERELIPRWVESGGVWGFAGGRFIDIGTPDSYVEAGAFFKSLPVSTRAVGRD